MKWQECGGWKGEGALLEASTWDPDLTCAAGLLPVPPAASRFQVPDSIGQASAEFPPDVPSPLQ